METIVLDKIPFEINTDFLVKALHIKSENDVDDFNRVVSEARRIGKPKAIYGATFVESRGDDFIVLDGVRFSSRVLAVNLDGLHRVFPFVATCGVELGIWAKSLKDDLHRFWAEGIMGMALLAAIGSLDSHIIENYRVKRISHMAPGSLADWPLDEQKQLFKLIGDTRSAVGVELMENMFMTPTKTVSGIRFAGEVDFESCQLCPRESCPGRRAPYDANLYERRYKRY